MFHGHPALLGFSHFPDLPEEAQPPLSAALACTPLLSSSAISGGETRHMRQLFCFDDSISPFSGISTGIIVLIAVFDQNKKIPNKFKTGAFQRSD